LIFTGLAVAFGFRAGLFNIGAPGQMVLGAVAAMLAGLYLPGPRLVVLPLAVLAAALGGAFWGAIPGWLKARFGANEVINTILLNYIAASLLLFILSSQLSFAAAAIRIFIGIGVVLFAALLLALLEPVRRRFRRAPRLGFALLGVALLAAAVLMGLPRPGDSPVTFRLPFKVPGSEPKSYLLQETARLQQLPELVGVDPASSGEAILALNLAPWLGLLAAAVALWLLGRLLPGLRFWQRLLLALGLGGLVYLLGLALGWNALEAVIPPTSLNTSFILALLSAVFMQYFLWRTKWGYELRAVGVSPKAAEYGGANLARNTVLALALSGAFAGLTATHYVLGGALEEYSLRQALPTDDGFDGIAVALLGGNTPVGVVLSAFLFGVLKNGGTVLNITFPNLTRDVVSMILALVVLFIAAKGFLPERLTNPLWRPARQADTVASHTLKPPTVTEAREGR
jgi:simple sugar transport system permease protein